MESSPQASVEHKSLIALDSDGPKVRLVVLGESIFEVDIVETSRRWVGRAIEAMLREKAKPRPPELRVYSATSGVSEGSSSEGH